MNKIKTILLLVGIMFTSFSRAVNLPLEIAEIYSSNKIVELENQKLVLIDFWATWCGPCRPATEQLEILQQQMKDDIFMVSLTDETHNTVAKFMEKTPINLMVLRDSGGNIIRKFNVSRRPYAVILNTKGNVVWKGHPSNLNYQKINSLVKKYRSLPVIDINKLFFEKEVELASGHEQLRTEIELAVKKENTGENRFLKTRYSVDYKGSLFKLIARIYNVPNHMVKADRVKDINIAFQSPIDIWHFQIDTVLKLLSESFNFTIRPETKVEDAYFIEVTDSSKLWDKNQIDWGEDNISNNLIGEDRLQADNITISNLSILLSNAKKQVFTYFGDNYELHDWDIHFRYYELMEAEFLNAFGIQLQKKKLVVTYFNIE